VGTNTTLRILNAHPSFAFMAIIDGLSVKALKRLRTILGLYGHRPMDGNIKAFCGRVVALNICDESVNGPLVGSANGFCLGDLRVQRLGASHKRLKFLLVLHDWFSHSRDAP